jgi:hypothetical protein
MAVVMQHVHAEAPRPRQLVPNLPRQVQRVILKAITKQPGERFPDMEAFAEILEALSRGEKVETGRLPLSHKTRRAIAWIGGVVFLVSLLTFTIDTLLSRQPEMELSDMATALAHATLDDQHTQTADVQHTQQAADATATAKYQITQATLGTASAQAVLTETALAAIATSTPENTPTPESSPTSTATLVPQVITVENVDRLQMWTSYSFLGELPVAISNNNILAYETCHDLDCWLRLRNLPSGNLMTQISGIIRNHINEWPPFYLSPDASLAAAIWSDGLEFRIWDQENNIVLLSQETMNTLPIKGLALSPNMEFATMNIDSGEIQVWDLQNIQQIRELPGRVSSFSNNGELLAVASGQQITLFTLNNLNITSSFIAQDQQGVGQVMFSPNDLYLAAISVAGSRDSQLTVFDISTRQSTLSIDANFACFSSDDSLVATIENHYTDLGEETNLVFWETASGRTLYVQTYEFDPTPAFNYIDYPPQVCSFSADGMWLFMIRRYRETGEGGINQLVIELWSVPQP